MKKAIFILTLSFLLAAECTKAGVIITNPEFDNTEADYMILSKIELTDTATIVYADVYNLPNYWIFISSKSKLKDSKGRIYKLLDCKGFDLDKEVYMPASGTMSFALYFEPVDKNEKIVDYIDSDENKATITGIKLYNVKHTEPIQCLLKGEVINRPQSNRLALLKAGEDFRTVKVTYIPIRDGKFEYILYANTEEAYQLIFYDEIIKGGWLPIPFIAGQETINFTLFGIKQIEKIIDGETWYSWEAEGENQITGSRYTNEYLTLKKEIAHELKLLNDSIKIKQSLLEEEGKIYTLEEINLHKQIKELAEDDPKRQQLREQEWKLIEEGKYFTPEAKMLEDESRNIYQTGLYKEIQYTKEHADIVGYTLLVENIRYAIEQTKKDVSPMFAVFHDVYEKKYPKHPYTSLVNSYINAAAVKVGNRYVDVSAVDKDDNEVKLSKLIKGKVALVHLWASWCGPCRKHGRDMIPVYEQYKDKGFTVVGIAREYDKKAMLTAIEKDKYPWINLLELNDRNAIWTIYGIGNAGGGEFLVDTEGNFLAVNPDIEAIKRILQDLFDEKQTEKE
jgi:thiol-disulfide isomerase/thioredoxin